MATRSTDELVKESKTLWYDFNQLCGTASKLTAGTFKDDHTVQNSLVESFAIACRKLACFFFPHEEGIPDLRGDDLGAKHFVADWPNHAPQPSTLLKDAKKRADRQVAHVTAERRDLNFVEGNTFNWKIGQLVAELRATLAVFLRHAPAGSLDATALVNLQVLAAPPPSWAATSRGSIYLCAKTCPPDEATSVRTICPTGGFYGTTE